MGLTEQGKSLIIKNFITCINSCTLKCSDNIKVQNCPLLCNPVIQRQTIKIIISADSEKCHEAGVVDGKTVFQSFQLKSKDLIIYQGLLNNITKPANAGLLVTINLSLGAI